MKKYTKLIMTLAIFTAVSNASFADGTAFTPLNFDDVSQAPKANVAAAKPIAKATDKAAASSMANGEVPIGNDNIQNALLELDNAQVGIRNDLVNYKAKYSEVDAQYKVIKNERSMLHKQVVSIERRIKQIDKTKNNLRKNML